MEKLSILSLHLGYGGIEKSVINVANTLCNTYDVEIISTYKLYDEIPYDLSDKVKIRYLIDKYKPNRDEWKKAVKKFKIFKIIKESYISLIVLLLRKKETVKAIKSINSGVVISTRILFNKWLSKYGNKNVKKIAWEHNHPHGNQKYVNVLINSCKNIDSLVLVSESLSNYYKEEFKKRNSECNLFFIPNSLDNVPNDVSNLMEARIVSVGRLSKEKGFPDLIDVFKMCHDKYDNLKLDIIGDGAQKNMIIDKIYSYKLNNSVTFHGFQKKDYIDKILNKSSLYVMTSFTESFGIVLIEAMSHGLPCISFTSAEGACDIIENGIDGYLIENRDKEEMSKRIIDVIRNYGLRKKMGVNAREKSLNYTSDNIKEKWIRVIEGDNI